MTNFDQSHSADLAAPRETKSAVNIFTRGIHGGCYRANDQLRLLAARENLLHNGRRQGNKLGFEFRGGMARLIQHGRVEQQPAAIYKGPLWRRDGSAAL